MAVVDDGETLESLLNKATNPLNHEDDWEFIMNFCDRVNQELEGVLTSTKLIIHKMQSPQEREALQALVVLQACVKNCGVNFQKELGKYRFLNELIKLVSPKYLGTKTSKKVQDKVISMLFTWSEALPDQVKIRDAYQMLKKQGIVAGDPPYDASLVMDLPPSTEDRDTLFTDEDKRKQLENLLKSTRPEDLQAANRLIKTVVKEDEAKMEKLKKRSKTLEEVSNNIRLLNEMLTHFNPDESAIADMQMMKELYEGCQKLRPSLFRLASDTDDDETALMDILRANDDVSRVMLSYEKIVQPKLTSMTDRKADGAALPDKPQSENAQDKQSSLFDLAGLSLASNEPDKPDILARFAGKKAPSSDIDSSFLLNFEPTPVTSSSDVNSLFSLDSFMTSPETQDTSKPEIPKLPCPPQPKPTKSMFADIGELSRGIMEETLGKKTGSSFPEPASKPTLNEMTQKPNSSNLLDSLGASPAKPAEVAISTPLASSALTTAVPPSVPQQSSNQANDFSLNEVFVALESIRPSTFPPLTAYDNNGIRVLVHFAKDHACPSRPDTLVSVVSIMSTRTHAVENVLFQAAAPKVMKVKLQPPSNTQLPAYNPIFSTPPLTQVMVISNPSQVS
ncbi:unnamed protein product [Clavelina lepadiformis]|uniref:ADP-ribosylation factor-binding protein GGA1 n=1 Tax=Clavelina lepadiformis TaxID=159417 RepID=A0ABP0FFJ3_CLALP